MESNVGNRKHARPLDISGYRRKDGLTTSQALADFLAWGRKMFPYQLWPWNMVHKAITGRAAMARPDSKEVLYLRSCASRARPLLRKQYGCDLTTVRQIGVRATFDSEDTARLSGTVAIRRMYSAQQNIIAVNHMVDVSEIKDVKLRELVVHRLQPLVKAVSTPVFKTLLTLPEIKGDLMPPTRK